MYNDIGGNVNMETNQYKNIKLNNLKTRKFVKKYMIKYIIQYILSCNLKHTDTYMK